MYCLVSLREAQTQLYASQVLVQGQGTRGPYKLLAVSVASFKLETADTQVKKLLVFYMLQCCVTQSFGRIGMFLCARGVPEYSNLFSCPENQH